MALSLRLGGSNVVMVYALTGNARITHIPAVLSARIAPLRCGLMFDLLFTTLMSLSGP